MSESPLAIAARVRMEQGAKMLAACSRWIVVLLKRVALVKERRSVPDWRELRRRERRSSGPR